MNKLYQLQENNKDTHIIFSMNNILYSVPIYCVVEILPFCQLHIPQKLPQHTIGLLDYNGLMLNVIDLRSLLGLEISKYSIKQKFLLVKTEESIFALVVDDIVDIQNIDNSMLQIAPINTKSFIQSIYTEVQKTISVINIPSIEEEIKKNTLSTDNQLQLPQLNQNEQKIALERAEKLKQKNLNYYAQQYYDYEKFLIFSNGNTKFCLDISYIEKILSYKNLELTKLPTLPDYISGIINFKGKFLTIINFSSFFNSHNEQYSLNTNPQIIILDLEEFQIGIIVDEILEITNINIENISTNNEFLKSYPFLEKQIVKNNDIYFIIDVEKLLQDNRMYINN